MTACVRRGRRRRGARAFVATLLAVTVAALALMPASSPTAAAAPGKTTCGSDTAATVGAATVVILVHGFASSAAAWTSGAPSMESSLSALAGVHPVTFDYSSVADHWVTDPKIGPALAKMIECYADLSTAAHGPGKVILVGHSMGGLAIRCALAESCGGVADNAGRVAQVITLDTPNTGSYWQPPHSGGVEDGTFGALGVFCLTVSWAELRQNDLLNSMCTYLHSLATSDAAHGFIQGSKELQALPPIPKGIPVHALAGLASFGTEIFGYHSDASPAGDLVVSVDSAGAESTDHPPTTIIDCGKWYVQYTTPQLKIWKSLLWVQPGICWHGSETGNPAFVKAVTAWVSGYVARFQPLTYQDLRSAPVPALCEFTGGKLANGVLPSGHGGSRDAERPTLAKQSLATFGDLNGDGIGDAAAVVSCNAGGVSWPDNIVFWARGANGQVVALGAYPMGDAVGDARGSTKRLAHQPDGSVQIATLDSRKYDTACCPSGTATVTLKWDGHKVVAVAIDHRSSPTDITFAGIGPIKLGMGAAELARLGYTPSPGFMGCVSYVSPDQSLYVTFDPQLGQVVKILASPSSNSAQRYQTPAGLAVGGLTQFAQSEYASNTIESHEDRSFGQGASGLLIGDGSGGWISVIDDGSGFITGLAVSDHQHYGALEAGCP
jgi:pimeloyl-ACP methyl ester carboxylesterase